MGSRKPLTATVNSTSMVGFLSTPTVVYSPTESRWALLACDKYMRSFDSYRVALTVNKFQEPRELVSPTSMERRALVPVRS
jgi:hypothetical protein